jgi:hypothetical protein
MIAQMFVIAFWLGLAASHYQASCPPKAASFVRLHTGSASTPKWSNLRAQINIFISNNQCIGLSLKQLKHYVLVVLNGESNMCIQVAWSAGCSFEAAEEAHAAAAAVSAKPLASGCGSVAWTAGCSFSTLSEAAAAAKPHLDAANARSVGCIDTAWTAACSI